MEADITLMNKNNIGYLLLEGVRSVFLHGFRSFAAICVTVACLLIMGSFCLITFNLNAMVAKLENENQVLAYIDESYSTAEAKSVGSKINLISNVENSEFISREEALQRFISEQNDSSVFEGLTAETLRDRFAVTLADNSMMKQTVQELESIEGIVSTSAHYEISEGFATVQSVLSLVSAAVILGLMIVSLFIISNTIKLALYDRKDEIAIMRVVGATNGFIRFPFVIAGILLGMISAVVAFFLQWMLYDFLVTRILALDTLKLFSLAPFTTLRLPLAIAYAVISLIIGVFGSIQSIRKFLLV